LNTRWVLPAGVQILLYFDAFALQNRFGLVRVLPHLYFGMGCVYFADE
jgi:hypothetical protein